MDPTVQLIEDLTDIALGRRADAAVVRASDRSDLHRHLDSVAANLTIDSMPEPQGRHRGTKHLVLKLSRFFLVRQRATNQALVGVVHELLREIDMLYATLEHDRRRAAVASAAIDATLVRSTEGHIRRLDEIRELVEARTVEQASTLAGIESVVAGLDTAAANAADAADSRYVQSSKMIEDLRAELILEQHRRAVLDRELRAFKREVYGGGSPSDSSTDVSDASIPTSSLSDLYSRFEDFFRPPGDDLNSRFAEYLIDLTYLEGGRLSVLDIGTGRGEFIELLRRANIPAVGIDTNQTAVGKARSAGLNVELVDARTFLASRPNESFGAVSAFHVVEHLNPLELVDLVDEIVRVLAPGGTLIFETPNPTNLVVGASSFYHDPTHRRPVTPDYLAFLLRDRGLVDVQTRFLHPLPEYGAPMEIDETPGSVGIQKLLDDVRWALKGPQDFAVVGRAPDNA